MAKEYSNPKHKYSVGDDVYLKKGTLLHGTYKNIEGLKSILKDGLISSWFIDGRLSKYPSSVGVWNLKNDCLLKDYVNFYSGGTIEYRKIDGEKRKTLVIPYDEMKNILNIIDTDNCFRWFMDQTKEARFMPSLVQNVVQIGIIFNGNNKYIEKYKSDKKTTTDMLVKDLRKDDFYSSATDEEITSAAEWIHKDLVTIQNEYLKWFEFLISFGVATIAYYGPVWMLMFQKIMRQMEMENEVMQFQTIILMLMKIERVNVEMILEWLERYSNIFREPISKCVNNFESGPWEALEELKNDVAFPQLIRIIESLQSAVEKIPIRQAFDELDTERAYYQEKRKDSNERLISRKSLIGKVVGFAPMVSMFIGYLIAPLCIIGLLSMTEAFKNMSAQM